MVRKIDVLPYDLAWALAFSKEAGVLRSILGSNLVEVHHIGSTAVPGLAAKPTIDMLLVVQEHPRLDACNKDLKNLGYTPKGENGIRGRRYFQKLIGDDHLYHLHAFEEGHPDISRHLNFRDYLRTFPSQASTYQSLKRKLAERFPFEAKRYTAGKSDFIQAADQRASRWRETSAAHEDKP